MSEFLRKLQKTFSDYEKYGWNKYNKRETLQDKFKLPEGVLISERADIIKKN